MEPGRSPRFLLLKRYTMAEIKSTLDLVMERTKNLTMTEQEKRQQALAEFRTGVSALIRKYADGVLSPDQLQNELGLLGRASGGRDRGVILDEIAKRIDPDRDNQRLLDLLNEICKAGTAPIESALDEYDRAVAAKSHERIEELRVLLAHSFGISGSAVQPNLGADSDWAVVRQAIRERFATELQREVGSLKCRFV